MADDFMLAYSAPTGPVDSVGALCQDSALLDAQVRVLAEKSLSPAVHGPWWGIDR